MVHHWGGLLRPVPDTFTFPVCSALAAFQLYCSGNAELQYPPLRILTPADMPTRDSRKRLSDYRFLMRKLEGRLRRDGAWVPEPTLDDCNTMFDAAADEITVPEWTAGQRKRRLTQLKWTTLVKVLRKSRTREAEANSDSDE
jgi:hypothetical protein